MVLAIIFGYNMAIYMKLLLGTWANIMQLLNVDKGTGFAHASVPHQREVAGDV